VLPDGGSIPPTSTTSKNDGPRAGPFFFARTPEVSQSSRVRGSVAELKGAKGRDQCSVFRQIPPRFATFAREGRTYDTNAPRFE